MFDLIGLVIIALIVGALGYVFWGVFKSDQVQDSLDDVKEELDDVKDEIKELWAAFPTIDELKKLTKVELLELADKLGIDVDEKLTKAKLAAEIDANRE